MNGNEWIRICIIRLLLKFLIHFLPASQISRLRAAKVYGTWCAISSPQVQPCFPNFCRHFTLLNHEKYMSSNMFKWHHLTITPQERVRYKKWHLWVPHDSWWSFKLGTRWHRTPARAQGYCDLNGTAVILICLEKTPRLQRLGHLSFFWIPHSSLIIIIWLSDQQLWSRSTPLSLQNSWSTAECNEGSGVSPRPPARRCCKGEIGPHLSLRLNRARHARHAPWQRLQEMFFDH